jgi:hypothetical protein
MTPVVTGMAAIITNVGLWVTAAATWIGDTIGVFTASGNELLLVPFYVGLVGIGFGLVRRAVEVFR